MECDVGGFSSRCVVMVVVVMVVSVLECCGSGGPSSPMLARLASSYKHESHALVHVFRYIIDR